MLDDYRRTARLVDAYKAADEHLPSAEKAHATVWVAGLAETRSAWLLDAVFTFNATSRGARVVAFS